MLMLLLLLLSSAGPLFAFPRESPKIKVFPAQNGVVYTLFSAHKTTLFRASPQYGFDHNFGDGNGLVIEPPLDFETVEPTALFEKGGNLWFASIVKEPGVSLVVRNFSITQNKMQWTRMIPLLKEPVSLHMVADEGANVFTVAQYVAGRDRLAGVAIKINHLGVPDGTFGTKGVASIAGDAVNNTFHGLVSLRNGVLSFGASLELDSHMITHALHRIDIAADGSVSITRLGKVTRVDVEHSGFDLDPLVNLVFLHRRIPKFGRVAVIKYNPITDKMVSDATTFECGGLDCSLSFLKDGKPFFVGSDRNRHITRFTQLVDGTSEVVYTTPTFVAECKKILGVY